MATGTRLMQEISDQFLNCKICFESFREPKTLTCLHTFCLDCLQQQYEQEVASRSSRFTLYTTRSVTCPLCRKKTELPAGGLRRLPDNFLVCNLNQVLAKRTVARVPPCDICASVRGRSVDACSKCLDCTKLLCKTCVNLHLSTKVTQQHSLIDLEGEKDIVCKVHPEEMVKFYCEPCGACICVVCTFQEHKDHEVLSFSDSYAKYRGNLESLLDQCRTRAEEVSSRLGVIDKYETVVKDVRDRIRDLAISSIAKVRAKERELMKRIDDVYGGEIQTFVDSRPVLQENLDELQNTVQFTDIMLRDKSVELLLIKRDIEEKMTQLLEPRLETVPSDPSLYDIRFVPGDVILGKLSFGSDESYRGDDDDIAMLKKKEKNKSKIMTRVQENGERSVNDSLTNKANSPQNGPDVITDCSQETANSLQRSTDDIDQSKVQVRRDYTANNVESTNNHSDNFKTESLGNTSNGTVEDRTMKTKTETFPNTGQSNNSFTSSLDSEHLLRPDSSSLSRSQRRAEREARRKQLCGMGSDRAPAPDLVPNGITATPRSPVSSANINGAFTYTPGRTIRSRKIQTEISALDIQAGTSNTDREFVQTMLQAELVAEKLKQEREELTPFSSRLRDRMRKARTAEMGIMTEFEVRVVPEMMDKETASDAVQQKDAGMQALSESCTIYTQTPVVRLEDSGMSTDREGQSEKGTSTFSVDLQDKETCTAQVMNETKATWTEGVATSDRATATMAIKLQHRAIGTTPTSTGARGCQVNPQVSAMYTNTPVVTFADLECQTTPQTSNMATMPDPDIQAVCVKHDNKTFNLSAADSSSDFLTPPQSPLPKLTSASTCDRASHAFHIATHNKFTETATVKTISSSTETTAPKVVDREMGTEETKTLDQWTETYTPTMINTGVTPPRPDTLEVGVATTAVLTDEQATCTDMKSFRDTQTETALVVCDGETLTDPIGQSDAQTCTEVSTESRQCETDLVEIADETCMTDYYNPWEAVDTTTQASQCDTAILKTKETNTVQLKRKHKEAQTLSDPNVCPECGKIAATDITKSVSTESSIPDLQTSRVFKDNSTMPQPQVTQDVGTMAISCNVCSHAYQETAIQTFQPQLYDKSSATSFDLHDNFLAKALSREYHDVATSTDSLPFIGLLSEIDVDELIIIPDSSSDRVSACGDSSHLGERVIMVDDETSTDFAQSVETGTQTFSPQPTDKDVDESCLVENVDGNKDTEAAVESRFVKPMLVDGLIAPSNTVCSNVNCPSRQGAHLVCIGVNTVPKVTFEKQTGMSTDFLLNDNMEFYMGKIDKSTSTLNRVRIVYSKSAGIGKKPKSVDKITMTSKVEQKEVGVETDALQVDGKITECISKLRNVSARLNSPNSPTRKVAPCSDENGKFFEKTFAAEEKETSTLEGSERDRQAHVKSLLAKTNTVLQRKDSFSDRKLQPITTLKSTKSTPPVGNKELPLALHTDSLHSSETAQNMSHPEPNSNYSSKSLPRGFTSERRSATVKMGSQPLSPPRLPLNRYNSAPGKIATVPAQTLLIKSAESKLGRSPSPRMSENTFDIHSKDNVREKVSPTNSLSSSLKSLDSKTPSTSVLADGVDSPQPQRRHPLPSITETRTPSSCSDNSTSSVHSMASASAKRQSNESDKKSSPGTKKKSSLNLNSGPKSPQVIPKRMANVALGAPNVLSKPSCKKTKDAPKSPSPRLKSSILDTKKSISPKAASPVTKIAKANDTSLATSSSKTSAPGMSTAQSATSDPNRLSVQSFGSSRSRSPSGSNLLTVADSFSDTGSTSSRRSSKEKIKSSPSKEKIKNSASTETIKSNTSNETVDSTKPKKSGGMGFMQRFLSKKKKTSEGKKEPVSMNTKRCPPTAEAVAALSSLPPPVSAAPTESYAHVPLQHPPHHYVPQLEVKPQGPVHKPSAYVYVNQRLISIQQDNVEEKRASRKVKANSGNILVAHKQAMFASKEDAKDKGTDTIKEQVKTEKFKETAGVSVNPVQDTTKSGTACSQSKTDTKCKEESRHESQAPEGRLQTDIAKDAETERENSHSEPETKEVLKSKVKAKKSEMKSASSWIRGRGDKTGKK